MGKKKYNRNTTRKVASVCDLSAALVSALKNKKGDAAISAAAEKNKKEDAGLANIGNGLIAPRSQLGFGTVPWAVFFQLVTIVNFVIKLFLFCIRFNTHMFHKCI